MLTLYLRTNSNSNFILHVHASCLRDDSLYYQAQISAQIAFLAIGNASGASRCVSHSDSLPALSHEPHSTTQPTLQRNPIQNKQCSYCSNLSPRSPYVRKVNRVSTEACAHAHIRMETCAFTLFVRVHFLCVYHLFSLSSGGNASECMMARPKQTDPSIHHTGTNC